MKGLIGIIGNTLYIEPFYGGDHEHTATLSDYVKNDLIERGVPVFPNYDYIEAFLYGMTYEEYIEQKIVWEENDKLKESQDLDSGDLPF